MASVLIVDDSMVMRKNLKNILVQGGYTVIDEAVNGEVAISKYQEHKPDFVTMDINMPEMDGIEAVKQIIAVDPKARIVMISSVNEKQMVMEALKYGAKYYVLKPVTYEKVQDAIRKIT